MKNYYLLWKEKLCYVSYNDKLYFCLSEILYFLSAKDFPSRTLIREWVSSSLSLWPISQWDNSKTLWVMNLKFCMVTSHDYLLWIRTRELISPIQTGPTSQISIFGKNDGLTPPIVVRFGSNFVQRSSDYKCLKFLRPFFNLPVRHTKTDQ